jgi:hypothetical protein
MNLKRFTNVNHLRGLGRPLLKKFFDKFSDDLKASAVKLPPETLESDDDYFKQLATVFYSPKELPKDMANVLFAVVELANDKGVERLTEAVKEKKLEFDWTKKRTDMDFIMEVWLLDPALMMEKHSEHHLLGMMNFHYWGTKTPPKERLPFTPPTDAMVELIRQAVDQWCQNNHRGKDTVAVTKYLLEGEWVFSIQHGGTMARLAEIKETPKTETLFYRPGKDDVVVYNIERDDIRIHMSLKGEEKLYRDEFGRRLRGDPKYFSDRKNFTLDPLRDDLALALNPDGVPAIEIITLKQVDIFYGGDFADRTVRKSNDLVLSAAERVKKGFDAKPFPDGGTLTGATFEIKFKGITKPRKVKLNIPDTLNVGRGGDRKVVEQWLTLREFRAVDKAGNKS